MRLIYRARSVCIFGVLLFVASTGTAYPARAQSSDTVVRNTAAPKYTSATLAQVWKIGTVDGPTEYQFSFIQEVFVTKAGHIWVVDAATRIGQPPEVRAFDADGKFLRRVGAAGAGPGEFRSLNGITQLPDGRMLMRDQQQKRINVYRPDGAHDTTWVLMSGSYQWPINGGGGVIADPRGTVWVAFSSTDRRTMYLRLRSNGTVIDTVPSPLPTPPAPPGLVVDVPGGTSRLGGDLDAPFSMSRLSPLGYFVTGVNSRYAFELLIPPANASTWMPGNPVISVRRPTAPPVAVSADEIANQRAILQYRMDRMVQQGGIVRSGIPNSFSQTKMAYERIIPGADGRIWVSATAPSQKYEPPDFMTQPGVTREPAFTWRSPLILDVFEPEGTYVGRVPFPFELFPTHMRGDMVWCVSRDEDGVNYLQKYRVIWK